MSEFTKGALVYYKSKAAEVTAVGDKIDILFFKTTKHVREKDILLLHPGPVNDISKMALECPEPPETLDETLELIEGEPVNLADLSELLYGEFTPLSAWSTWLLVTDGLYFEWDSESNLIEARPLDIIRAEKEKRDAKQQQKEAWDSFLERIKSNKIIDEDHKQLTEVEQLACGEREGSRILKAVGLSETKEAAHNLLLKLGYWQDEVNPWPRRMGINMQDPVLDLPEQIETERLDLKHLTSWAIDDVGNQDPDDAISLDGERVWVHVADVSSLVAPESELDIEARSRGTNVYLPDQTIHMLPTGITAQLGLGLQEESKALSIGFVIGEKGELSNIDVCFSDIKVKRTTYDDADAELETTFADLKAVTDRYHQRRIENNAAMLDLPEVNIKVNKEGKVEIRPYSRGGSRQLVTEAMLAAGEAIAQFAEENNIPIPFANQPEPEEIQHPEKMSEHYAYRRCFKASRHTTEATGHFGLGLPRYTRVTSPIRRYLDLIVHQQLRAFLTKQPLLEHEALVERIGLADEGSFAARKAERNSNQHWTLIYLKQQQEEQGGWQGDAVVVMQDERKTTVVLPDLAIEPKLRKQNQLNLDDKVTVLAQSINIPDLQAFFKVV